MDVRSLTSEMYHDQKKGGKPVITDRNPAFCISISVLCFLENDHMIDQEDRCNGNAKHRHHFQVFAIYFLCITSQIFNGQKLA